MPGKQITLLVPVTGGHQLLEPKVLKILGEVFKEVAHPRIIAVAIDHLALEVMLIIPEFILNI